MQEERVFQDYLEQSVLGIQDNNSVFHLDNKGRFC